MQLLDNINKNKLLNKIESNIKIPYKERDNKIEENKKNTLIIDS